MRHFLTLYYLLSTMIITVFFNCNAQTYLILTNIITTENYSSTAEKIIKIKPHNQDISVATKKNVKTLFDEIFKTDINRTIPRETSERFSEKPENQLWKFTKTNGDKLIKEINNELSKNLIKTFNEHQKSYTIEEASELEAKEIRETKAYNDNLIEIKKTDEINQKKIPAFIETPTLFTIAMNYLSSVKFPIELESRRIKHQNKKDSSLITSDYLWINQNNLTQKETVNESPNDGETIELIKKVK